VALVRTPQGWSVVCPAGSDDVDSLVEGLTLADLIGQELGDPGEPDRSARRSARGPAAAEADADPRDARIAALERTVAQLEHALAARVSTERAIGVLAERTGSSPRAAFEALRRNARSSGRPVADLAREVLESLSAEELPADGAAAQPLPESRLPEPPAAAPRPELVVAPVPGAPAPAPRPPFTRRVEHARTRLGAAPGVAGDGRS
jgi:hypothetical protein